MENADKIKRNLRNAGHEIDEVKQWIPQRKQTLVGMQYAFSESERHAEELTVQLLKAKAQLQRETAERKQAEKKLRTCQHNIRNLTLELLTSEERERRRLAEDLHDTVAQCLAGCRYKLELLQDDAVAGFRYAQVSECIDFIKQAIRQTRLLIFESYPWILNEPDLETTLRSLAHRVQEVHGILVECKGVGIPKSLSKDVHILLFRTIRELLMNVVKHSKARHATISISREENQIRISVVDDGIGFNIAGFTHKKEKNNGFGLFSIRERLSRLGGRLDLISYPGQGTQAVVVVPE